MSLLGITRWNPETRAGAVAVRPRKGMDLKATQRVANLVKDWSEYQNLSGDADNVETSPIQGTYDWRAYLHEETKAATDRERERERSAPRKKDVSKAPAPAPTVFYA